MVLTKHGSWCAGRLPNRLRTIKANGDQELQEIPRDAQTGKRRVDRLFRVFRREGAAAIGQRAVLDALEIRFARVPEELRHTIETIRDEARLRALLQAAIRAVTLDEFTRAV